MESTRVTTSKPITKDEAKILLSFIEESKIIYNKTTNATNNKLKTEEWNRISDQFNAVVTTSHRTPTQLRLKWENLKKNSRKRNTLIRMNNIKTGGGGPDYIPPDEVLDRVATLLGSTVDGFTVRYGGDAEPECTVIGGETESEIGSEGTPTTRIFPSEVEVLEVLAVEDTEATPIITPKKSKITLTPKASGYKRKQDKCVNHRSARDQAIANYYNIKSKVLETNLENVILENKKLKLEMEKLQRSD